MLCKYNMIVDFARPQKSNTIIVAENDVDSRQCNFRLLFDKEPFDMTGVVQATVTGVKGDQSYVYSPATIMTDDQGNNINEIYWVIPGDITDDAGVCTLTIELCDDQGAAISSFEFYVKVRNALYNEDDFINDDDKQGLRDLIARMTTALTAIEQMVSENELPNPYPIRITMDGFEFEYTGLPLVEIEMDDVGYLGDATGLVEVTEDDSSAEIAVEAAETAVACAADAGEKLEEITNITNEFESKIPTATVVKSGDVATITITDQNGTTVASVEDGSTGATPSITAEVTIDSESGTPTCVVTKTGTDEYPTLSFAFSGLKGAKGDQGSGASMDQQIMRTSVTASAGDTIRIPASGTDERITTENTCVVRPIADAKTGGYPYKVKTCEINEGYVNITLAEAISNVDIGVAILDY